MIWFASFVGLVSTDSAFSMPATTGDSAAADSSPAEAAPGPVRLQGLAGAHLLCPSRVSSNLGDQMSVAHSWLAMLLSPGSRPRTSIV